jgi:hypothetical protein
MDIIQEELYNKFGEGKAELHIENGKQYIVYVTKSSSIFVDIDKYLQHFKSQQNNSTSDIELNNFLCKMKI